MHALVALSPALQPLAVFERPLRGVEIDEVKDCLGSGSAGHCSTSRMTASMLRRLNGPFDLMDRLRSVAEHQFMARTVLANNAFGRRRG